jgi:hypothetical protein
MNKENVGCIHNGVLFSHKMKSCRLKKNGWNWRYHVKQNKLDAERKTNITSFLSYAESRLKKRHKSRRGPIRGRGWQVSSREGGIREGGRMTMITVCCIYVWKCYNKTHYLYNYILTWKKSEQVTLFALSTKKLNV